MQTPRGMFIALLAIVAIEATLTINAAPVGNAFTYQGALSTNGQPANGAFDLRFSLYTNSTGGGPVTSVVTNQNVRVLGGLFATAVDFGLNVYDGTEYWLDLGVRPGSSTGPFTVLGPRQLLTPAPYALHAKQAGSVPPGAISGAAIQDNAVVRSINGLQDNFTILGDGLLVDTVGDSIIVRLPPPSCLTYSNCYWNLRGNGNLTAGTHFLGTVAGETAPLEFRVNNNRSLLHQFTAASTAPNITGGFLGNTVSGVGGTISGGGQLAGINQVQTNWGAIGGGFSNVIVTAGGAIAGGASNRIAGNYGAIGGGAANIINPLISGMMTLDSPDCAIGGGISNTMTGAEAGTIGGGRNNSLVGSSSRLVHHATIAGGRGNSILSDSFSSHHSTIGGGVSN